MKADVLNWEKKKVGEVELADDIFVSAVNNALVYEAVKMQLANKRLGTVDTRNTARMSGTTAKMYRQKGTGRARHGSYKRNIFVGGGVAFGPHPRDYRYTIPAKAKRGSVRAALALKQTQGKLIVVDEFPLKEIKTKKMVECLKKLGVSKGLVVLDQPNQMIEKSIRNIASMKSLVAQKLNALDVMRADHVVIMSQAVPKITEWLKP